MLADIAQDFIISSKKGDYKIGNYLSLVILALPYTDVIDLEIYKAACLLLVCAILG